MSAEVVQVDDSKVVIALGKFRLSLAQNEQLMNEIGASQLLSVRHTFRDQGVPAGSWVPLSPNTIRRDPKRYGAGHKLLIGSGRLLNSIRTAVRPGSVVIGTNLVYAAVHQFGSLDRSVAIGPQTEGESKATVNVKTHGYFRLQHELGSGRLKGAGRRKFQGPQPRAGARYSDRLTIVEKHGRHQNIPPRPYLVFRPEDPTRIRNIVTRYVGQAKQAAGLGAQA
jgi:phage gpG-like protein